MSDRTNTFYAAAGGFHGYGTQLMMGNGASPETFQAVAEVIEITPGTMETAVFERTHLRSPEAHREKLLGLRDSGPFVCKLNWLPTDESQSNAGGGSGSFTAGGVIAVWRNRLTKNWKIVLSDGSPATEWPFTGGITKFQPGTIGDAKTDATLEITPMSDFSAQLP